jgi:hypothetical protein
VVRTLRILYGCRVITRRNFEAVEKRKDLLTNFTLSPQTAPQEFAPQWGSSIFSTTLAFLAEQSEFLRYPVRLEHECKQHPSLI